MLLFNILPIIPLDGSKIINLIFSKYLNLNFSNNLTVLISFITLSMILIGDIYEKKLFNGYGCIYITSKIYGIIIKKIEYIYNKFVLERYLYNIKYKSVKIINNKNKMYKNKTHLFKVNNSIIEEKSFLSNFFDKKP